MHIWVSGPGWELDSDQTDHIHDPLWNTWTIFKSIAISFCHGNDKFSCSLTKASKKLWVRSRSLFQIYPFVPWANKIL